MAKNNKLFERNVPGSTAILQRSVVAIAGCGGLGSNAAVSLVRAGIGKLIIADPDIVEESNLNRQYYFQSDVGQKKVDALTAHLKAINPEVIIDAYDKKISRDDISEVFKEADLLIEAFDKAENKLWLIEAWCKAFPERAIICASGISGLGNTDELRIRRAGHIYFCGDEKTDMSMGLCSARVAIVANMQVNIAIEILTKKG